MEAQRNAGVDFNTLRQARQNDKKFIKPVYAAISKVALENLEHLQTCEATYGWVRRNGRVVFTNTPPSYTPCIKYVYGRPE